MFKQRPVARATVLHSTDLERTEEESAEETEKKWPERKELWDNSPWVFIVSSHTSSKALTVLIVGDTIVLDYLFKNVCIATALEDLVVSPSRAKYNNVSL